MAEPIAATEVRAAPPEMPVQRGGASGESKATSGRSLSEEDGAGVGLSDSATGLQAGGERDEEEKGTRTTSIAMVVPATALFGLP